VATHLLPLIATAPGTRLSAQLKEVRWTIQQASQRETENTEMHITMPCELSKSYLGTNFNFFKVRQMWQSCGRDMRWYL